MRSLSYSLVRVNRERFSFWRVILRFSIMVLVSVSWRLRFSRVEIWVDGEGGVLNEK